MRPARVTMTVREFFAEYDAVARDTMKRRGYETYRQAYQPVALDDALVQAPTAEGGVAEDYVSRRRAPHVHTPAGGVGPKSVAMQMGWSSTRGTPAR